MPMMTMTLILVCVYFACLVAILFFHKHMNPKTTILIFIIVDIVLFAGYWVNEYFRKGYIYFITFDQISPFMFTMMPLSLLLKDKYKDVIYTTTALLSLGMLVAMLVSPLEAYLGSYRKEASLLYVLDVLLHLNCSLFGTYLFVSKTVKVDLKSIGKASSLLYLVIGFAIIINFIFKTNYFGMGYYGNYGIYMIRIFESYWATLLAYLLGIMLVLMLGFEYVCLLLKLNINNSKEEKTR